jgi:ethanolamine utilization protein EutJ
MKTDPSQQARLFPVLRPVMEKVAGIVVRHVELHRARGGGPVDRLVLVGGTAQFPGIAGVVEEFTGIPARVPDRPHFVTPLGIALHDILPEPPG